MLISFEGLSKSGKTTLMNRIINIYPEAIAITGPRMTDVGIQEWLEYQRWEHAIKKPIFDANPEHLFLANRAFSEAVYTTSEDVRETMFRLYGGYDDAAIVYTKASYETLHDRQSHDIPNYELLVNRYQRLLDMFEHVVIPTDDQPIRASLDEIRAFIDD